MIASCFIDAIDANMYRNISLENMILNSNIVANTVYSTKVIVLRVTRMMSFSVRTFKF